MKSKKKELSEFEKEKKRLEDRNEFLEMQNAYFIKLDEIVNKEEANNPKPKKKNKSTK